jgi:hypothetical protein
MVVQQRHTLLAAIGVADARGAVLRSYGYDRGDLARSVVSHAVTEGEL